MREQLIALSGLLIAGAFVYVYIARRHKTTGTKPTQPEKEGLGSLQAARDLVITDAGLELVPDRLDRKCPQLARVDLHGNQLQTFPPSLCQLSCLHTLNLSSNLISKLPDDIGQLQQLEDLNLAHNQLAGLPSSIGQLRSLKYFNVMGNVLESLPDSIGDLKKLYRLGLKSNKLRTLPATFGGLEGEALRGKSNLIYYMCKS